MDRIYCGTGKEKFGGNLVEVSLCLTDLPKDKIFEYNGKKYIKLKVVKKKEVDQYGKSHYVEVDMFEPQKQETGLPPSDIQPSDNMDEDLPF